MSAGISMADGSEIQGLWIAGGISEQRNRTKLQVDGVWRLSHVLLEPNRIVELFGLIRPGALIAPFPLILSRYMDEVFDEHRPMYNNPHHFRADPDDLFVLVDIKVQPAVFSFQLLPASPSREQLAWYHLPKRRVTEALMGC